MLFILIFITVLGCGLVAGIFFAFSNFVMKALGELSPPKGIAVMQSINRVVLNPLFLGVFIGTAVICIFLVVNVFVQWYVTEVAWIIAGGLLYLVGSFLVTVVFHVPWNEELAKTDPGNSESVQEWNEYLWKWTAWNHVRTFAAFAAMASCIVALLQMP